MNKRAFLLFEVTLTVAILSIGLVFIVRSISTSMRVAQASVNYSKAISLANTKVCDLELSSHIGTLDSIEGSGVFSEDEDFSWEYTTEEISDYNLSLLTLEVSWKEGKREGAFDIVTYINATGEE